MFAKADCNEPVMPELPEVETMRRGILAIRGARISDVCFPQKKTSRLKPIVITPSPRLLKRRLKGRVVDSVDRIGKRVAVRLDSDDTLVFEPRMTGLLLVWRTTEDDPPTDEHVRFGLEFETGPVPFVWYWDRRGLGNVTLYTPVELEAKLGPDQLGPDALNISAEQLHLRLSHSRRAVKVALLDQKVVAGIGNLYASEILHRARVHPEKRCDLLSANAWQAIHAATNEILNDAIKYEGSTLSDGTYRNALNKDGSYQNHHRVYDRAGKPCQRCKDSTIERIVLAQRSTFYCRKCQPKRRATS